MLFSFNTRKNTKKFADDTNDKKKANEKLRRFMLAMLAWAKFDTFIIDETKGRRSKPEGAGEADLTSEPVMGHKSASGPMDGVGKPGGATLVDIESLS